jgi:hypothetical protein
MRAAIFHGPGDIDVETADDPADDAEPPAEPRTPADD